MNTLMKFSASAVIAATLTLCLSDSSFAQRRGDRPYETRRGDVHLPNGRVIPNRPSYGNGNGYGNARVEIRRDRWGRDHGQFNGSKWHIEGGITIRNYGRRYAFNPAIVFQVQPGMQFLGSTFLNQYTTDFDTVYTGGCGYRAIQVRVTGNDANIDHLAVTLDNGEIDYIDINSYFQNGSWSQWIDLNGFRRCIRSVAVVGKTIGYQYSGYGYNYQAQVELYGRY